eukprot:GHRQ01016648.1.p1 GENE.GHRQ01016648.1~~GHRQ01016648.1.p1  ORF type:complete len:150 (+),score=44.75 GHRQ01016648.1:110-559(+)
MCGILACLASTDDGPAMRARVLALSRRQRHRGPDWSGMFQWKNSFLAHERLAIIDPASGDQPLFNEDKTVSVCVNGEIYNYKELREQILAKHPNKKFATDSDCEVRQQGSGTHAKRQRRPTAAGHSAAAGDNALAAGAGTQSRSCRVEN